jgi:ribonucleotide monophosphatase NagD (HAD superfamily)
MIGDRLDTDILGAQNLEINTALVLTGITDRQGALSWDPPPQIIAADALEVIDQLGDFHE